MDRLPNSKRPIILRSPASVLSIESPSAAHSSPPFAGKSRPPSAVKSGPPFTARSGPPFTGKSSQGLPFAAHPSPPPSAALSSLPFVGKSSPPFTGKSRPSSAGSSSPPPFAENASPPPSEAHSRPPFAEHASPPTPVAIYVPLGVLVAYEGMSWSSAPEPAPRKRPPEPIPHQRPPVPAPSKSAPMSPSWTSLQGAHPPSPVDILWSGMCLLAGGIMSGFWTLCSSLVPVFPYLVIFRFLLS